MRKRFCFLLLIPLFFCLFNCFAQNEGKKDINVDSAVETTSDDTKTMLIEKGILTDTLVQNKHIVVVNDSAEAFKEQPEFVYTKNLDSLLKVLQKKQTAPVIADDAKHSSLLESFFFSTFTMYFFWAAGIFFIGFILYKLFYSEGIFQRPGLTNSVNFIAAETEHLSAATNYNILINKAVANKDYRMATRYHYLQTLQKLTANNAIQFTADKTNSQYLQELQSKPYRQDFLKITLNYEYAWYGGFDITELIFERIERDFSAFYKQI